MSTEERFQYQTYENNFGFIGILCIAWWAVNLFQVTVFNFHFMGGNSFSTWVVLAIGIASFLFLTRVKVFTEPKSKLLVLERRSLFRSSRQEFPFSQIKSFYVQGGQDAWREHATHDTNNGALKMLLRDNEEVVLIKWGLGYDDKLRTASELHAAAGLRGEFQNRS